MLGGMVTATVLAVFFVPVFFVSVLRLFKVKPSPKQTPVPTQEPAAVPAEA